MIKNLLDRPGPATALVRRRSSRRELLSRVARGVAAGAMLVGCGFAVRPLIAAADERPMVARRNAAAPAALAIDTAAPPLPSAAPAPGVRPAGPEPIEEATTPARPDETATPTKNIQATTRPVATGAIEEKPNVSEHRAPPRIPPQSTPRSVFGSRR